MTSLNDRAAKAARDAGVHAVTDVTGFGLLGHLREVLAASGVSAEVDTPEVPIIVGAASLLADGFYPGGSKRNLAAVAEFIDGDVAVADLHLLADAQTSGGLLMSTDDPVRLLDALTAEGVDGWRIGRLTDEPGQRIRLRA